MSPKTKGGEACKMNPHVLAIIPAYNEQDSIASTMDSLKRHAPWVDCLIVDDGSTDATVAVCQEHGFNYVSHATNLGLAGAFQTGMKYAHRKGYDYAIQFDADGQHDAQSIQVMLDAAVSNNANIVIGSRFVTVEKPKSARMAGSALLQAIIRLTTGQKVVDPTSGMRMYDAEMIEFFANAFDFGPEPDTIALLMRRGAKLVEVQVTMHERTAGKSYLTMSKSIMYMLSESFSILFAQWFRGNK